MNVKENGGEVFRILVADDFPPGRLVVMRQLQIPGYRVDGAENGRQAVEAFERTGYDLILMDVEMPEMDGWEATRAIRLIEDGSRGGPSTARGPGSERVVIIGLTGNAGEDQRVKCSDSGMDDCLEKPVFRKDLLDSVGKWLLSRSAACEGMSGRESRSEPVPNDAPMRFETALSEFEGDMQLLNDVLTAFLDICKAQSMKLYRAFRDGDGGVLAREAHAVRGGAANLTADSLAEVAAEIESLGSSGVLEGGAELLERYEKELLRLESFAAGKGVRKL
ncbi:MAG: response regulator [Pseudomonadota bacterium]